MALIFYFSLHAPKTSRRCSGHKAKPHKHAQADQTCLAAGDSRPSPSPGSNGSPAGCERPLTCPSRPDGSPRPAYTLPLPGPSRSLPEAAPRRPPTGPGNGRAADCGSPTAQRPQSPPRTLPATAAPGRAAPARPPHHRQCFPPHRYPREAGPAASPAPLRGLAARATRRGGRGGRETCPVLNGGRRGPREGRGLLPPLFKMRKQHQGCLFCELLKRPEMPYRLSWQQSLGGGGWCQGPGPCCSNPGTTHADRAARALPLLENAKEPLNPGGRLQDLCSFL